MVARVAVYGLSTEGIKLASALASRGIQVSIVDEEMQLATDLSPQMVRSVGSVYDLVSRDHLLGIRPVEAVLGEAEYIFFTPKVKKGPEEGEGEVNSRLRDVSKNLSKGATLVYGLPTGIGGSEANTSLIEKISGLSANEGFEYVYAPLQPSSIEPYCIGVLEKPEKDLLKLLSTIGLKPTLTLGFHLAEVMYASHVIINYVEAASQIEAYRMLKDLAERVRLSRQLGGRDVYLNELSSRMLDLKVILHSMPSNEPLVHLASNALRIVEGYIKRLIDEVRELMRSLDLKASRTRIVLGWSVDRFEMRGDRARLRQSLVERLRDFVGDVVTISTSNWADDRLELKFSEVIEGTKIKLILSCSGQDHKMIHERLAASQAIGDYMFMRANLLYETVGVKGSRVEG